MPVIVQQCLPRLGFPWTIRIIGFIMLVLNIVSILLYRTRLPPRKTGPIVDWASFRELPYSLYCTAMFFNFWGLYFAFFYIGSYGRNVLGATYQQSINLLLVTVCMGFIFRLLPTYYADKIGSLNVLIPFAFLCGIMVSQPGTKCTCLLSKEVSPHSQSKTCASYHFSLFSGPTLTS